MLLSRAGGAEVGRLTVKASQLEKAARCPRLTLCQIEHADDGQAEWNFCVALLRVAAPLAVGTAVPAHVLIRPDIQ